MKLGITKVIEILELKYPVEIIIVPAIRFSNKLGGYSSIVADPAPKCMGCYWFDNLTHEISISDEFIKEYRATLIHELVHAWQFENYGMNMKRCHHGKRDKFKQWQDWFKQEYNIEI